MKVTFCCKGTEPEAWLQGLRQALPDADVSVWQPGDPAADYAVVWAPPQQFMDEQPGLKAIFNIGAGVDALMRLQLPANARIVRLEDAGMSVQMAEYVTHAVVRHFRELDHYKADMRRGHWQLRPSRNRADFSVGIMGLGVLGARVAQTLQAFEFPVRGWSRSPKDLPGMRCWHGDAQLPEFLQGTRVLVNLLPLTPQTENILNRQTMGQLLPGAYIINVARGAHLVEEDLLALLDSGHIAGATLDVFRQEPLPPEHPFWQRPELCLTPHTSARTLREDCIRQIVDKVAAMSRGENVGGMADPNRGY